LSLVLLEFPDVDISSEVPEAAEALRFVVDPAALVDGTRLPEVDTEAMSLDALFSSILPYLALVGGGLADLEFFNEVEIGQVSN